MAFDKTTWIGGEHVFTLGFGQIEALQDATGFGLEMLLNKFRSGDWKQKEVYETVRQGLIGGGVDADEASKMTFGMAERGIGLVHFKLPALLALEHALYNKPEDFLGKSPATAEAPKPTPPEDGSSAESTPLVLKLDSPLPKSEK